MIDKRMSARYTLEEIYTIPRGSLIVGEPGDKPVCIEEGTANSAMALRSSGGFTIKMTEPWVVVRLPTRYRILPVCTS